MQHCDLAALIELDPEVAKEIVSSQQCNQHRPKRCTKLDRAPSNSRDKRVLGIMVVAEPGPGVDRAFLASRKVDPQG
jgi:hypothetical protein